MIHVDGSKFRAALGDLLQEYYDAAGDALTDAVDAAAKDAFSTNLFRNHTWKLRSGTKASVDQASLKGRIENRVGYARFVEEGTKWHFIVAKRVPKLRFYSPRLGRWVVKKYVKHPGTKPRPFFRHAGEVGTSVMYRELQAKIDSANSSFSQAA